MAKIIVQNIEIRIVKINDEDYICLTDMIKTKAEKAAMGYLI